MDIRDPMVHWAARFGPITASVEAHIDSVISRCDNQKDKELTEALAMERPNYSKLLTYFIIDSVNIRNKENEICNNRERQSLFKEVIKGTLYKKVEESNTGCINFKSELTFPKWVC